jgi:hypothetical protein
VAQPSVGSDPVALDRARKRCKRRRWLLIAGTGVQYRTCRQALFAFLSTVLAMFAFLFRSLPVFHCARVLLRLLSLRGLQFHHPEFRKLVICRPSGLLCYWCISRGLDLSEERSALW